MIQISVLLVSAVQIRVVMIVGKHSVQRRCEGCTKQEKKEAKVRQIFLRVT